MGHFKGICITALAVVSTAAHAGSVTHASGRMALSLPPTSHARPAAEARATAGTSTVTSGMLSLGVSAPYAAFVANTLSRVQEGDGAALSDLNRSTASLAARWRAEKRPMGEVVAAFKGAGDTSQVRTFMDKIIPLMTGSEPVATGGGALGARLASPGFR